MIVFWKISERGEHIAHMNGHTLRVTHQAGFGQANTYRWQVWPAGDRRGDDPIASQVVHGIMAAKRAAEVACSLASEKAA